MNGWSGRIFVMSYRRVAILMRGRFCDPQNLPDQHILTTLVLCKIKPRCVSIGEGLIKLSQGIKFY